MYVQNEVFTFRLNENNIHNTLECQSFPLLGTYFSVKFNFTLINCNLDKKIAYTFHDVD